MSDFQLVTKGLKLNRWYVCRVTGSHYHFKHPEIACLITVPYHGKGDLHPAVLHNILKMAKLSLNDLKAKKAKKSCRNIQLGASSAVTNSH